MNETLTLTRLYSENSWQLIGRKPTRKVISTGCAVTESSTSLRAANWNITAITIIKIWITIIITSNIVFSLFRSLDALIIQKRVNIISISLSIVFHFQCMTYCPWEEVCCLIRTSLLLLLSMHMMNTHENRIWIYSCKGRANIRWTVGTFHLVSHTWTINVSHPIRTLISFATRLYIRYLHTFRICMLTAT